MQSILTRQQKREAAKELVRSYFKDDYGNPFDMSDGQSDIFIAITTKESPRIECIAPTQYGKEVVHTTPVLTTGGWKTHGQLRVGDYVFNHLGKPVMVQKLLKESTSNQLVRFSNGEEIQCHPKHEWVVKSKYDMRRGYDFKALETQEIKRQLTTKKFSIPNIYPIEFNMQYKLSLDPYFLGAWLGDGSQDGCHITIHPDDVAIINRIPYKQSTKNIHKTTGIARYSFAYSNITQTLRGLDLYKNKHIPDIYKYASIQDRLQLLAGLIDTDGHVNKEFRKNGNSKYRMQRVYFTNTNKRLVDDFIELVTSLGMRTSLVTIPATVSSSGIEGKKTVYVVGFQPYIDIPTVLPRKKIVAQDNKRHIRIKDIVEVEPKPGRCIQVEGGVYLVGRKLIPTHNSSTVAIALIVRTQLYHEDFGIVTGSEPKSQIIMEKVIQHTFDNDRWTKKLELDANEPLDRIRRQRTRKQVTWKGGGSIRTFTADSRNRRRVKDALTGLGSPNLIEDEASLIPDDLQSMILRMLGGHRGGFLFKIGNPFFRNHFYRTHHNDKYQHIFIDYKQALAEGRYTEEFVQEMRGEAFFDVLYECKFPEEDVVNEQGWRKLITVTELEASYQDAELEIPRPVGRPRLGVDIAAGGANFTAFVLRYDNYMVLLEKNRDPDLMSQVGRIERYMEQYGIASYDVTIDDNGVGHGVTNRLAERDIVVNAFRGGTPATENNKYVNIKAESFWLLGQWIKEGGKIVENADFYQINEVNYKVDSTSRLKVEPKDELIKRGIPSPDVADAASLTFTNSVVVTADDFAII